jgi:DHA1 family inner membrane transport protein
VESAGGPAQAGRVERSIGIALCAAMVLGWAVEQLVPNPSAYVQDFAPGWLPLLAAAVGAAGLVPMDRWRPTIRGQRALRWAGLLLMVWTANGLPFDLLTAAGLIGHRTASGAIVLSTVWWPGLATRTLALGAAIVLAHLALASPRAPASVRSRNWLAYAAFALALPYPVLRTHWALGGTIGLTRPGAAGEGFAPLLLAIPWLLAAALSMLLVSPRRWPSRRLLLVAGWSATAIVAMIGPAALWSLVSTLATGGTTGPEGIATWVFGLFYGSWFLWAIAGGAATRSYQLRTAAPSSKPEAGGWDARLPERMDAHAG